MLRAGLIGLPSSGKTTLFELLTSVHEAPRTHGKAEANVGVSRVPDARLDQLTAMFQPKKRVPATVEFADMAAGRGDAKSLVDVVAYRNADALLHVVRAFRDPAVPASAHHRRSGPRRAPGRRRIDPRRSRVGRTAARAPGKGSQEEPVARSQSRAGTARARPRRRSKRAARCARSACRRTTRAGCADFSFCPPSRCCSSSISTKRISRSPIAPPRTPGSTTFLAQDRRRLGGRLRARSNSRSRNSNPPTRRRSWPIWASPQSGLDRVIRAAYDLLGYMSFFTVGEDECRAWSIPRETRAQEAAGAIHSDIQRGLHSRGSRAVGHAHRARIARGVPRSRRAAARGQGLRRARRRHDQFPPCHVTGRREPSSVCEAQVPFIRGGAEALVAGAGARVPRARLRDRAREPAVQVVSENGSAAARGDVAAARTSARATAGRSTCSSRPSSPPTSRGIRTKSRGSCISIARPTIWWTRPSRDFTHQEFDVALRDRLIALDTQMLGECRGLFSISATVSRRVHALQRSRRHAALPSAPARQAPPRRPGRRLRAVRRPARERQARGPGDSRHAARARGAVARRRRHRHARGGAANADRLAGAGLARPVSGRGVGR